jgi:hypothetical protein
MLVQGRATIHAGLSTTAACWDSAMQGAAAALMYTNEQLRSNIGKQRHHAMS